MLCAIVAVAKNNVIGRNNELLWYLPNDLKHFRAKTNGHTIIMGRKTFESLKKVLPNRHHIVITRNLDYHVDHEQVTVVHSLSELFPLVNSDEEHFVIGGGEIYQMLLPLCNRVYLTQLHKKYSGDTVFLPLNSKEWEEILKEKGQLDERNTIPHTFYTYVRK